MIHFFIRSIVNLIVGGPKRAGNFQREVRVIIFTFGKMIHPVHCAWEIELNLLVISIAVTSYEFSKNGEMLKKLFLDSKLFGYPKDNPDEDDIPF